MHISLPLDFYRRYPQLVRVVGVEMPSGDWTVQNPANIILRDVSQHRGGVNKLKKQNLYCYRYRERHLETILRKEQHVLQRSIFSLCMSSTYILPFASVLFTSTAQSTLPLSSQQHELQKIQFSGLSTRDLCGRAMTAK